MSMEQATPNCIDNNCRAAVLTSILSIMIISLMSAFFAVLVSNLSKPLIPSEISELTDLSLMGVYYPESFERKVFQIVLLLTPLLVLLSNIIIRKLPSSWISASALARWGYGLISLLGLLWINSWAFWPDYMKSMGLGNFSFILPASTLLVIMIFLFAFTTPFRWLDGLVAKKLKIVFCIVLSFSFLVAISFRIFNWKIAAFNLDFDSVHHTNPVLYYISLAETGYYSTQFGAPQYGFYSFYLKPIFYIIGLNLYSFSLVMTFLYLSSLALLVVPIFSQLRNIYLKLLLIPVLCGLHGLISIATAQWIPPIFQYYPIRFLVPATSVFMLYLIIKANNPNLKICLASIFSFILGFFAYWNFDSNIVTLIAWLCIFLIMSLSETIKNRSIKNHAVSMSIAVIFMMALGIGSVTYILIRSDLNQLAFSKLFETQRIFYMSGFCMLPIPRVLHPWMALAGVYISALAISFPAVLSFGIRTSSKLILALYLSILGIGLFSYYQGRSHDMNLASVSWPAFLCCFLACDWCFSAKSTFNNSIIRFIAVPFVVICVSLTFRIVGNITWYFERIIQFKHLFVETENTPMTDMFLYTADWLSKYRNEPSGSVLILHPAEALFCVESGLHPSALIASDQERFFMRRQEQDLRRLLESGTVKHLFTSTTWSPMSEYQRLLEVVRSNYRLEETSSLDHWVLKSRNPSELLLRKSTQK